MPTIKSMLHVELDPSRPVPEICEVISAVASLQPGQEKTILTKLSEAINKRLEKLKGAATDDKQVLQPGSVESD